MEFSDFSNLQNAIRRIGIDKFEVALLKKLKLGELEGDTGNIENIVFGQSGIYHLEKGVLAKVILHITDIDKRWLDKRQSALIAFKNEEYDAVEFIKALHKYHFTRCMILQSMFSGGRKKRYYMAQRMDGTFNYSVIESRNVVYKSKNQKLNVCQYCLGILGKLMGKTYHVANFDLNAIFYTQVAQLNDAGFDLECNAVPNIYANDWSQIAQKAKEQVDYKCQGHDCGISLEEDKQYLHCHHIDANRTNNLSANLKVLCIECHAKEPQHGHIKTTPKYNQFLELKRNYAG